MAAADLDGWLLVDAGDAFVPTAYIATDQRPRLIATAEFLVDRYNASEVAAMALGDRDLFLGPDALAALAERARFPFLAANLVDAKTKAPAFADHLVVERGGVKIGLIGAVSPSGARRALRARPGEPAPTLALDDLGAAAKRAADAARAEGAQLLVALAHLTEPEEQTLIEAVPDLRLLLSGQSPRADRATRQVGEAVAVSAGQKGKQVGVLTVVLAAGQEPDAPLVDPGRKGDLERRLKLAKARIGSLEKRVADAKSPGSEAQGARPTPPTTMWERQLAGARAEVGMLELELQDAGGATDGANTVSWELISLSQAIADDVETKKAVDLFRVEHPDPKAKAHARRPALRRPTPSVQPPQRKAP